LPASLLVPSRRGAHGGGGLLYFDEVLYDDSPGVSRSRNVLAERACGEVLVYVDDDAGLSPSWVNRVLGVLPNQIYMVEGRTRPISRVVAIRKETLVFLGGWDERITCNGEDLDLYIRARKAGVQVIVIPSDVVWHRDHEGRRAVRGALDSAYVRVKHGIVTPRFFVQKNPLVALARVLGVVYWKLVGVR